MKDVFKNYGDTKKVIIPIDLRNLEHINQTIKNVILISKGMNYLANNSEYGFDIFNGADENLYDYVSPSNLPKEFINEYTRRKDAKHFNRFAYNLYSSPLTRVGVGRDLSLCDLFVLPDCFRSDSYITSSEDGSLSTNSDLIIKSLEQARYAFVLGRSALLHELGFYDTFHMQYNLFGSLSNSLSVFSENLNCNDNYFDYKILNEAYFTKLIGTLEDNMNDPLYKNSVNDNEYSFNVYLISLFKLLREVNNAFKHRNYDNFVNLDSDYETHNYYYDRKFPTDDAVDLDESFENTKVIDKCTCFGCGKVTVKADLVSLKLDGIGLMGVIISNNTVFTSINKKNQLDQLKKIIKYLEIYKKDFCKGLASIEGENQHILNYIEMLTSSNLTRIVSTIDTPTKDLSYTVDFVLLMKLLHLYYLKTSDTYDFIDYSR